MYPSGHKQLKEEMEGRGESWHTERYDQDRNQSSRGHSSGSSPHYWGGPMGLLHPHFISTMCRNSCLDRYSHALRIQRASPDPCMSSLVIVPITLKQGTNEKESGEISKPKIPQGSNLGTPYTFS